MRPTNEEAWHHGLDKKGRIDEVIYELKCSNCGHIHGNISLTARIEASADVSVAGSEKTETSGFNLPK